MYRKPYRKPQVRTITVKYAGTCHCCRGEIKAGQMAEFYPVGTAGNSKGVIAHIGGLDGNSSQCFSKLKAEHEQRAVAAYVAEGLGEW